jgi:hypothetical protein
LSGENEDWGKDVIIAQIKQYVETLKKRVRITPEEKARLNREQREYKHRTEVSSCALLRYNPIHLVPRLLLQQYLFRLPIIVQKTSKRNNARQRIGDEALGFSSTDLNIILHHDLASPEVSDDETPGTIFVAKLSFRSDEVKRNVYAYWVYLLL